MKKILSLMLAMVVLIGCVGLDVRAEETTYPKADHELTTTEDFASDDWKVSLRGAYLGSGTTSIARKDSTHINISGITNATRVCDEVTLYLFVERSTSYATGYSTYRSYSYTLDDVYQVAKEISNIAIERGYYYRVKGVHSVLEGNTRETTNSVTDPIDFR